MSQFQLIKSFVTGLNFNDRYWIDATANGSILELSIEESYELIQKVLVIITILNLVRMITILDLQETSS